MNNNWTKNPPPQKKGFVYIHACVYQLIIGENDNILLIYLQTLVE